jgi:predicted nucleic acid-binding protein
MPDISAIILDSSALIAYLEDERVSWELDTLWNDVNASIEVPSLVLSELCSVLLRKGIRPESVLQKVRASCIILQLDADVAVSAGELHAELKKKVRGISLADCIIMAHADKEGATIITRDNHFKHYKNVKILS